MTNLRYSNKVMMNIDNELDSIKNKAFGKVNLRTKPKPFRVLEKLQKDKNKMKV